MAKNKKGFNWKARNPVETLVDNSTTYKINVDLSGVRVDKYDQCNALVLPSKKRKTKKKKDVIRVTKILSKKQRKILEKIVDKKKKKENRTDLLAALSKVQTTPEVLSQLTSITEIQTKGLKRHLIEEQKNLKCNVNESGQEESKVNSISGSRKHRKLLSLLEEPNTEREADPNIVGFQDSSDDGEDSSDNEDDRSINDQNITEDLTNTSFEGGQSNIECTVSENKVLQETTEANRPGIVFENKKLECSNEEEEIKICRNSKGKEKVPAVFVPVQRNTKVQENRMKLPILAEEQIIMEAIKENPVVVLAGETGSGKTTQVPQFLYEAGYALNGRLIGITEPRRVAAISMSKRIAEEMNLTSREVSYLIRFEGNTTEDTQIKFMTDGVLLKEIQTDFLLNKYSVVILDEAHERSVYTDILIGLLSRIVPLRNKKDDPLKLIIMSATLRLEDFTENTRLFREPPPVIKVDSRQFPVTIHFNKNTLPNYLRETYKKVCKIHTQLPDGGVLVFLTGQKEVNSLVRKLRKTFPYKPNTFSKTKDATKNSEDQYDIEDCEELDLKQVIKKVKKVGKSIVLPDIDLDKYSALPIDDTEGDLLAEEELLEEEDDEIGICDGTAVTLGQPLWVLPLFSVLSSKEQAKVFEPPPSGCRLCVVATNVAETSLTIPHIKYVVDSGKVKTRMYDKVTGVSAFTVTWTSKAAANQRAGRAGRMGPGHCYRLYSSAVFNDIFEEYSIPEIQRKPVDDLVLQMKAMSIIKVLNFPFPSAPDVLQLRAAERRLFLLGVLEGEDPKSECSSHITALGRAVSALPVSPRFGKILALGHQYGLLPYAVCLVAALSVQEVLLEEPNVGNSVDSKLARQKCQQVRRSWAGVNNSLLLGDPMVLLRAVGAAEYAGHKNELEKFCQENGLRHKAVIEVRKLRLQLTSQLQLVVPGLELTVDPAMTPPSDSQSRHLRQLLLAGFPDQVAHKVDPDEIKDDTDKLKWKHAYRCAEMEEPVFMHSSSVLRRKHPEWVIYQEVFETNKLYIRGITAIEPEWLPSYAPALCNLSQPVADPPPSYDTVSGKVLCHVGGTFGRAGWQIPIVQMEFPAGVEKYRWFARFLLDGSVCPKLVRYTKSLLSTPASMVKSWAHLQERTDIILKALMSKQVDCREKLYSSWKDNPTYLLAAYQKWLPESAHNEIAISWPPL